MALIKLNRGGPIFYKQERVGKNGRYLVVIKFRSMKPTPKPMQADLAVSTMNVLRASENHSEK